MIKCAGQKIKAYQSMDILFTNISRYGNINVSRQEVSPLRPCVATSNEDMNVLRQEIPSPRPRVVPVMGI